MAASARGPTAAPCDSWAIIPDPSCIVSTNSTIPLDSCNIDLHAEHDQSRRGNSVWVADIRLADIRLNHPVEPLRALVAQGDLAGILILCAVAHSFTVFRSQILGPC